MSIEMMIHKIDVACMNHDDDDLRDLKLDTVSSFLLALIDTLFDYCKKKMPSQAKPSHPGTKTLSKKKRQWKQQSFVSYIYHMIFIWYSNIHRNN